MRMFEMFTRPKKNLGVDAARLKTYAIIVKLPNPGGSTQLITTTVMAVNPEMARKLIRVQYNNPKVILGQPREIKSR